MASLIEILNRLEGGEFIGQASEKLAEIVRAVDTTGKAGSLTITIGIRPATKVTQALVGKVSAKVPVEPSTEILMFPTPDGNLLANDPAQTKLDLREVAPAGSRSVASL